MYWHEQRSASENDQSAVAHAVHGISSLHDFDEAPPARQQYF
jgi:hypothetical protein